MSRQSYTNRGAGLRYSRAGLKDCDVGKNRLDGEGTDKDISSGVSLTVQNKVWNDICSWRREAQLHLPRGAFEEHTRGVVVLV